MPKSIRVSLACRTRNSVAVGADPLLTGRHQLLQAEKKFIIDKPTEADAGNYTCTIKGTKDSASFTVLGKEGFTTTMWASEVDAGILLPFLAMIRAKLPDNTAVVEGEKLTLHCIVVGTDPEITWTIHGKFCILHTHRHCYVYEDHGEYFSPVFDRVKAITLVALVKT